MHSTLLEIPLPWGGSIKIFAYGFMLATAFITGMLLIKKRCKSRGCNLDTALNLCMLVVAGSIIGARLFYCIQFHSEIKSVFDCFRIWNGGLVYYGGFFGAVVVTFPYCHIKKISFLEMADLFSPSVALGIGITRIGCFLNGCCYGPPTQSALGVRFPLDALPYQDAQVMELASKLGLNSATPPLHPVQLYSSASCILMFVVLILFEKKFAPPRGVVFLFFCVLYAIYRFLIEFLRIGNPNAYLGLTISQAASIAVVITATVIVFVKKRHAKKNHLLR